jgi:hypothetical protein
VRRVSRQMGGILDIEVIFHAILIIFVLVDSRDSDNLIGVIGLLIALLMVE